MSNINSESYLELRAKELFKKACEIDGFDYGEFERNLLLAKLNFSQHEKLLIDNSQKEVRQVKHIL